MMQEQYVSFEVAKLLKEKGFIAECSSYYLENGILSHGNTYSFCREELRKNPNNVVAPTQSLAMRWLREVHKIDIITFHECLDKDFYWSRIEKYPYIEHQQDSQYISYELSVEAAIQYCLENLL